MSRHIGNDVTLLPLITFFTMYLSLCTSLNETVCSCAVILVDCTGIASTGVGSHGCMPLQIRRHKFELGHIDKLRMLRIRVQYWGARLEPVDLHPPCDRLNREIPTSASSPKKANRENRHISSIVHDVFYARFEFWVPTTFHAR